VLLTFPQKYAIGNQVAPHDGDLHGPAWLMGMPYGVEASWLNVALPLIGWFMFANWLRDMKYPRPTPAEG
jgi:hypothetical protein